MLKQTLLLAMTLPLLACTTPPPAAPLKDQLQFRVAPSQLQQQLQWQLAPLANRLEAGSVTLQISGPQPASHASTPEALRQQLAQWLALDTRLIFTPTGQGDYQVQLDATLQPDSCRYARGGASAPASACLMLRNQYRAQSHGEHWARGARYDGSGSALDAGAVQRLYQGKAKSAKKQQTTGE
ncbi:MAG: pilus assembly protein FlpD [Aeromonas sobria]|uniref:pilus assembly protein FlpD n=1 Tax=Aeromonas sobria TaxID=646 RepID=UPI003F3DE219